MTREEEMSEVLSQINSTWLQGTINIDYNTLVKCFGEPDPDHCDDYKSDAEWRVAENAVGSTTGRTERTTLVREDCPSKKSHDGTSVGRTKRMWS